MGMRYSFLDTIDFYKVLNDENLDSEDKVIFLFITLKRNEQLKKTINVSISDISQGTNIPKRIVKESLKNLTKRYFNIFKNNKSKTLKLVK